MSRNRVRSIALIVAISLFSWSAPSDAVTPPGPPEDERPTLFVDRVLRTGTALDPDAESGLASRRQIFSADALTGARPFLDLRTPGAAVVVEVQASGRRAPRSIADLTPSMVSDINAHLASIGAADDAAVEVRVHDANWSRVGTLQAPRAADLRSHPRRGTRRPRGGMVWLTGGEIAIPDQLAALEQPRLVRCGDRLCLEDARAGRYELPVTIDALFVEIWDRAFDRGVETFYLSINPTEELMHLPGRAWNALHAERVLRESDTRGNYRVVMLGDLERTQLGRVLYEADVFFKSAGLGLDVLRRGRVPGFSQPSYSAATLSRMVERSAEGSRTRDMERFCRFYWASEPQELRVEAGGRLTLRGRGATANSEAMVRRDAQLVPYPKGRWCRYAQAIAEELNATLDRGTSLPAPLSNLHRVASTQNLVSWLRRAVGPSGVGADARELITSRRAEYTGPFAPQFTSGVRTPDRTIVVADHRASPTLRFHVFSTDRSAISDALRGYQATFDELFARRMRGRCTASVAQCISDFERLSTDTAGPNGQTWHAPSSAAAIREIEERMEETGGGGTTTIATWRPEGHLLPVEAHGGCSLAPGLDERLVLLPSSQHPVLDIDDDSVRAWSQSDDPAREVSLEYLRVNGVRVIDRWASEGTIRLLVEASARSTPRLVHQVRLRDPQGAQEWIRTRALSGRSDERGWLIYAGARCTSQSTPCFVPMTRAVLARTSPSAHSQLALDVLPAGRGRWIVQVTSPSAPSELEALRTALPAPSDARGADAALAYLRAAASFGSDAHLSAARDWILGWFETQSSIDEVLIVSVLRGHLPRMTLLEARVLSGDGSDAFFSLWDDMATARDGGAVVRLPDRRRTRVVAALRALPVGAREEALAVLGALAGQLPANSRRALRSLAAPLEQLRSDVVALSGRSGDAPL